ncbi:MAG: site-specific DNA-methyltransferase [bacterium]|nr:site-specific DNA-methyltransferase [bacterium]
MPTLTWAGKEAVVNHHQKVPFHLLKDVPSLSVGDPGSGNLIVEGDNLVALKALLPYYAGQVKCIYIDPPYNTGNEKWVYNDNVNSPVIKKWLGQVVGDDASDLSRHDKWLCMMYPRLQLLRKFLTHDGAIFISLDDNEIQNLRSMMDEIYGGNNFVAVIIWQKRTSPDARLNLGPAHDYVVVYSKNKDAFKATMNKVPPSGERTKAYKNPDNDPRGPWASTDLTGQTGHATPDQYYSIPTPLGTTIKPPKGRCWALAEKTFLNLLTDNRIWFGKKGTSRPRLKKFLNETEGVTTWTWWPHTEVGHNQEATKELNETLGTPDLFDNPKPTRLIKRILQLATGKDSLILDSFAGSGTTGHALVQLNKQDGGTRRFILVEMESKIARELTAERLRRVCSNFNNDTLSHDETDDNAFRFCTLGTALFDQHGAINPDVKYADLARHVYFTETGEPLPHGKPVDSPLLGISNGVAIYLLFNGILGDRRANGGNILTRAILAQLPPFHGQKIIYAAGCLISEQRLRDLNIAFRQTPYEIKVT